MIAKSSAARAPFPAWPGILCLGLMALGGAVMLFLFDPTRYPFYPVCLFHRLTGWNCPGCGSLRAMHQLLHGHWITALRCNAVLMLSMPCLAFLSLRWLVRWRAGLPLVFPVVRPSWIAMFLGGLAIFTILRNVPGAPFIYLSPP